MEEGVWISKENYIYQPKKCFPAEINSGVEKMKDNVSPDNYKSHKKISDITVQGSNAVKSPFQCRYLVAVLLFLVCFEVNILRISTSISVVAMVNQSAVSDQDDFNSSSDSCTLNTSVTEESSIRKQDGEFLWSPAIQGYVLGAGFLGYVITLLPGGILAEAYGGKIIIVSGVFISSLSHLLSPFAAWSSIYLIIVIQFIRGLGQGMLMPGSCVLSANWFPTAERGFLNSIVMTGFPLGALVSGISSGAMCSSHTLGGWPSVYYIYGSLGLLLTITCQIFLFESPNVHPRINCAEVAYIAGDQEAVLSKKRPPTPWKKIFLSVQVHALTYASFGAFWIRCHFLSVQPIFLGTILHYSIQENGFYTSVPFVFQALFTFFGGWISKWLNTHNYVGVDKVRKGCNFLCCFGYSLALLGVYYAGCDRIASSILSIAAMSFIGFAFAGCLIAPVDMSPTFAATLLALTTTTGSIASFIFPVLVGIMTDKEQSLEQWNKIFMISIGIVMSSGIIFWVYGSAEVQPWNYPSVDDLDKDISRSNKDTIELEKKDRSAYSVSDRKE